MALTRLNPGILAGGALALTLGAFSAGWAVNGWRINAGDLRDALAAERAGRASMAAMLERERGLRREAEGRELALKTDLRERDGRINELEEETARLLDERKADAAQIAQDSEELTNEIILRTGADWLRFPIPDGLRDFANGSDYRGGIPTRLPATVGGRPAPALSGEPAAERADASPAGAGR